MMVMLHGKFLGWQDLERTISESSFKGVKAGLLLESTVGKSEIAT
jgi:hypothetical protein